MSNQSRILIMLKRDGSFSDVGSSVNFTYAFDIVTGRKVYLPKLWSVARAKQEINKKREAMGLSQC